MRKYPVTLIKDLAHRNIKQEGPGNEPEMLLRISQEGLKTQKDLLQKRHDQMLKNLSPDTGARLRLIAKGVDLNLGDSPKNDRL